MQNNCNDSLLEFKQSTAKAKKIRKKFTMKLIFHKSQNNKEKQNNDI